ncbi:GNAT family N-acetyltransferase [Treponema brennaborense]|uniref:N-acetyltransferase domain-containing protein n=1 Tax=Treponema brennaborense (strain DSM 12168 / CIP 105900 / DD5/3) TaxID=906968 RepID=F4LP60_TREBD|nr:GNAT family N-acetyltransferase [Treponema brennaborense]AEE15936.1 hypothetical protein Trebr_0493 [Treponema brennaborense DSM 12168]
MGSYAGDMIANLTTLPPVPQLDGAIKLKRVYAGDKSEVLEFIRSNFNQTWVNEAEAALSQNPIACFIATENGRILGFACYDATAKGFFGPTGVTEAARGRNVGKALLIRTMEAMREAGYGYAIIGWTDVDGFYRKAVGAEYIPGGTPENSVYSRMVSR